MAQKNINHLICYAVLDSTNHILKKFDSYEGAITFKIMSGRPDWSIKKARKHYHSTEKQRNLVRAIESALYNVPFVGDINSGWECSDYISMYKDDYDSLMNDLIGNCDCLGY